MPQEDEHRKHTVQNAEMGDEFRVTHTITLGEDVKELLRRVVRQFENR